MHWGESGLMCTCKHHGLGSEVTLEVHYIVIQLSSIMKPDDIAIYTGISPRSVKRILQYFAIYGRVEGEGTQEKR
jgi:hypothetical protein